MTHVRVLKGQYITMTTTKKYIYKKRNIKGKLMEKWRLEKKKEEENGKNKTGHFCK